MTDQATSFDLARPPAPTMVDPVSGELVHRSETDKVGLLLQRVRDYKRAANDAAAWCTGAILEAMDSRAEWTLHSGPLKLIGDSPTASVVTWDVEELKKLKPLLGEERYRELVVETVSYEPQTGKLQNAAKAGGEIQAIIERAQQRRPRARYVKVSRG